MSNVTSVLYENLHNTFADMSVQVVTLVLLLLYFLVYGYFKRKMIYMFGTIQQDRKELQREISSTNDIYQMITSLENEMKMLRETSSKNSGDQKFLSSKEEHG